jgi:hypothetical protein
MTRVFKAFFNNKIGKYCLCVIVKIWRYQSLKVILFGTSSRPDGLSIIVEFGSRITLLESKNSCETTIPFISLFMSLLLVHVSWGPLCTYPSTLCVYHPPLNKQSRISLCLYQPAICRFRYNTLLIFKA